MATWKEGSSRYLVGKMQRIHAKTNEDRFRCFVYEQATPPGGSLLENDETLPRYYHQLGAEGVPGIGTPNHGSGHGGVLFYVAQSGDATCNGLSSGTEGSRTMTLFQAEAAPSGKCRFPPWLTAQPRWHTLDYGRTYSLLHRNTTLRIANTSGPPSKGGVTGTVPPQSIFHGLP